MRPVLSSFLERTIDNLPKGSEAARMRFRTCPDVGHCTDEMAHAMSGLDGYDHDRDMPTLQRWKDYWDAAVMAAPSVSADAAQMDRIFIGKGEYVRADEAMKTISDLQRNLRHWREECGKLHAKISADRAK